MTIYEFSQGDEIVRNKPSKAYSSGVNDRSYMGEKLVFVGIDNGYICCKRTDDFSLMIFGDKLLNLPLDIWDEGWELYVNPRTMFRVKNWKFGR